MRKTNAFRLVPWAAWQSQLSLRPVLRGAYSVRFITMEVKGLPHAFVRCGLGLRSSPCATKSRGTRDWCSSVATLMTGLHVGGQRAETLDTEQGLGQRGFSHNTGEAGPARPLPGRGSNIDLEMLL